MIKIGTEMKSMADPDLTYYFGHQFEGELPAGMSLAVEISLSRPDPEAIPLLDKVMKDVLKRSEMRVAYGEGLRVLGLYLGTMGVTANPLFVYRYKPPESGTQQ